MKRIMKNYKTYLFDADGTLLDYDKAELQALKETFRLYNLTYNQQIEKCFSDICNLEQKQKYNHDFMSFIMTTLKAVFVN